MSMINEKFIHESFSFSTDNENEFFDFLKEVDEHTWVWKVKSDKIEVMAVRNDPKCSPPNFPVWRIEPDKTIAKALKINVNGTSKTIAVNERFQPATLRFVKRDSRDSENLLMTFGEDVGGDAFFLSRDAISTLCQRIGYDGGRAVSYLDQASEIAKRLMTVKTLTKAVIKTAKGSARVYAFLSDRYVEKKLSETETLVNEFRKNPKLGRIEFVSGSYNHRYTRILYKLPEYEEKLKEEGISMIPYIEVTNSDTGNASYTVSAAWKMPTSREVFYSARELFKHNSLKTSDKDIVEQTYAQLEHYVTHLKHLKEKPLEIDEKIIEKAIEEVCFGYSPFSKKRLQKVALKKVMELAPEKSTAYDLTEIICQLPELLEKHLAESGHGLCEETYFKLRKTLANTSTLDFKGV